MIKNPSKQKMPEWKDYELEPLKKFFLEHQLPVSDWPTIKFIEKTSLPKPYDFLLTQEVMTLGISQHFQRTPKIKSPLYKLIENYNYFRTVIVVIDSNGERDDADTADKLRQAVPVELGFININMEYLSKEFFDTLENTSTPFGLVLKKYCISTVCVKRHFFKIKCIPLFSKYLNVTLSNSLYGRINIINDENNRWLANIVEVLA